VKLEGLDLLPNQTKLSGTPSHSNLRYAIRTTPPRSYCYAWLTLNALNLQSGESKFAAAQRLFPQPRSGAAVFLSLVFFD
jgi:hypothetical protein